MQAITFSEFYERLSDPERCVEATVKRIRRVLRTKLAQVTINLVLDYLPVAYARYEPKNKLYLSMPITFTFQMFDTYRFCVERYTCNRNHDKSMFCAYGINDHTDTTTICTECGNRLRIYNDVCNLCHDELCFKKHWREHASSCPELFRFYSHALLKLINQTLNITCEKCVPKRKRQRQHSDSCLRLLDGDEQVGSTRFFGHKQFFEHKQEALFLLLKEAKITVQVCHLEYLFATPIWTIANFSADNSN
jgi:hypothetical protein